MIRTVQRFVVLALCGALVPLLTSCSTIVSSSQQIVPNQSRSPTAATEPLHDKIAYSVQQVPILSSPRDAEVLILTDSGQLVQKGTTPMVAYLSRNFGYFQKPAYRVAIEKPGYHRKVYELEGRLNLTWYLGGNFLFGGLIGYLVVDPWTGAMWTLAPGEVNAILSPIVGSAVPPEPRPIMLEAAPMPMPQVAPVPATPETVPHTTQTPARTGSN